MDCAHLRASLVRRTISIDRASHTHAAPTSVLLISGTAAQFAARSPSAHAMLYRADSVPRCAPACS
ncbi:MAG: hypothetical protein H6815_05875 [Phycisphaeraceae bacterium]|nr:hypothetical protein [Phycisphaerales bacterium]MCB9859967.1 hypothetical protein [Phycisphaeraceae bacterium]